VDLGDVEQLGQAADELPVVLPDSGEVLEGVGEGVGLLLAGRSHDLLAGRPGPAALGGLGVDGEHALGLLAVVEGPVAGRLVCHRSPSV
jgi:hypothetical protein